MKKVNIVSIKKINDKHKLYDLETTNSNFFANGLLVHNSNMAVCFNEGELWVQGRNQVRTLLGDQNGMAAFVKKRNDIFMGIFNDISKTYSIDTNTHTIVLDGEYAGENIQKGNSAVSGTSKGFYIFDYFRIVNNTDNEITYIKFPSGENML